MSVSERDPELDSYLERVKQLDESRQGRRNRSGPSTVKPKPAHLNQSYPAEDFKKAQVILDGEYVSERYESEGRVGTYSEMAYRSAYNYEQTFSPKKHGRNSSLSPHKQTSLSSPSKITSSRVEPPSLSKFDDHGAHSKTFVVSEEDYLLLRKLKANIGDDDVESESLPSRGKPRELRTLEKNSRELRTLEKNHRPQSNFSKRNSYTDISSDDEETPPPLPSRSVLHSSGGNSDEADIPRAPARRGVPKIPPKRAQFEVHNNTKPRVTGPPRKADLDSNIEEMEGKDEETSTNQGSFSSLVKDKRKELYSSIARTRPKEKPDLEIKSDDEQDWRPENNEQKSRSAGKSNLSQLSVQPQRHVEPRSARRQAPLPPTKRAERPTGIDTERSFSVDSQVKSNAKSEHLIPKVPLKPVSLRECPPKESKRGVEDDKPILDAARLKLRPVKERPQVPEKRVSLTSKKDAEQNAVPPKPILRTVKPSGTSKETHENIPEALAKREKLAKAPPVPQRKISMPDALKRAETMRQNRSKNLTTTTKEKPVSMDEGNEALLMARKLRPLSDGNNLKGTNHNNLSENDDVQQNSNNLRRFLEKEKSKTFDGFDGNAQSPVAIPFMVQGTGAEVKKLFKSKTESSLPPAKKGNAPALTHVTKSRARGPRRKLPSGIELTPN